MNWTLTIDGRRYHVERGWHDHATVVTPLGRPDHPGYQVAWSDGPEALTGPVNEGLACECPDFANRHAGTGSHGCKHVKALAQANLLPAHPALAVAGM